MWALIGIAGYAVISVTVLMTGAAAVLGTRSIIVRMKRT